MLAARNLQGDLHIPERLTREQEDILLARWRENGDQTAYAELYTALQRVSLDRAKHFAAKNPDFTISELLEEACLPKIRIAIEKYEKNRAERESFFRDVFMDYYYPSMCRLC